MVARSTPNAEVPGSSPGYDFAGILSITILLTYYLLYYSYLSVGQMCPLTLLTI